jgi:hypothetical protein
MLRRPLRRTSYLLVAVLASGGLGGAACRRHPPSRDSSATALGPFRLGEEVRSRARVTLSLDMAGRAAPQKMELAGDWVTTVSDIRGGEAQIACTLADLKVDLTDGTSANAEAGDPAGGAHGGGGEARQRSRGG